MVQAEAKRRAAMDAEAAAAAEAKAAEDLILSNAAIPVQSLMRGFLARKQYVVSVYSPVITLL